MIFVCFKSRFVELISYREGVQKVSWSSVLSIFNGKNYKAKDDSGLYPIYASGGLIGYTYDFLCDGQYVLLGRKGTIDKPYLVSGKFWNVDTVFAIKPNDGVLNATFLLCFCKFYDFQSLNRNAVLPSLIKSDLLRVHMPVPIYSDQLDFERFVNQVNKSKFIDLVYPINQDLEVA